MSALTALLHNETRLFFRDPPMVFWCIAFPVGLLVVFGLIPAFNDPSIGPNGQPLLYSFVPTIGLMSVAFLALNSLPATLGAYRERLVLKRLSATPVGRARIVVAQLWLNLLIALAMGILVYAVAVIAFDVPLPKNPLGTLIAFLLGVAAALAIGLLVAATAPTGKAAQGIGTLLWFPLMFFAGLWVPLSTMPHGLATAAQYTPLGAAARAIETTMAGGWPSLVQIAVCLGWTLIAGGAAIRFFRWQ